MKNRLFIKLSMIFLLLLLLIGSIIAWISFISSCTYYEEVNQKLHNNIAEYARDHVNTFTEEGDIDSTAIQTIMESMMVINPDVEVYLLNTEGEIMTHVAPYKEVVRKRIDLAPVKEFIDNEGKEFIRGDDPRDFSMSKVFSAAPVYHNDKLSAYYYIILTSQERSTVLKSLSSNYAYSLGFKLIWLVLGFTLLLGLAAFWYQTRSLTSIMEKMQEFKDGNFGTRISETDDKNFGLMSRTFNSMAAQIQAQFEKIESVNNFRKELIANVSHDLRTPMSVISGYAETLLLKPDLKQEERNKYLHIISDSTDRLSGLVGQLFELSKLENNQIELNKEPFSIEELAQDLLTGYEVLAEKKNIKLIYNPSADIPLCHGDISMVERVIQNLVDNALKFTPEKGKIEVIIEKVGKHIRFSIKDNGVGIAEDKLVAIFDKYQTTDNSEAKKKGMGLGLAIAKKIVEMHDSSIEVSSKLNKGTSFTFNLPIYDLA